MEIDSTCPACDRGKVTPEGICDRCGVGIPRGAWTSRITHTHRVMGRGPDRDHVSQEFDYARTRADKS